MPPSVRRWRWVGAAVAVALVAAAAAVLPRLLAGAPAVVAERGPDCVPAADATLDAAGEDAAGTATWVRFCPLADDGATQRVRHPQGVVSGDLAASLAVTLWQTQLDRPACLSEDVLPGPSGMFRIEVGLAGGEVTVLEGDTGCSERDRALFSQLETTLLMEAAADGTVEPAPPVTCPRRLTATATNRDGASADQLVDTAENPWQSTVPLLPMPAVSADVCAYTGRGKDRRRVDQWQVAAPGADAIRSAATLEVRIGAMTDCAIDPERTSYVVVLTDQTGTSRTLTIDPTECSPVTAAIGTPPVETSLGLATNALVDAVTRSRP